MSSIAAQQALPELPKGLDDVRIADEGVFCLTLQIKIPDQLFKLHARRGGFKEQALTMLIEMICVISMRAKNGCGERWKRYGLLS
ncbi:hypothetical protein [Janthinobacterium lividum]|uniref:hypothetical protein n=1 Tax=Janthinobacterium sp. LB2P10 TaxID=3424194 RepID=UPI00028920EB